MEFIDLPTDMFYEIGNKLNGIDKFNYRLVNKTILHNVPLDDSYIKDLLHTSFIQFKERFDQYYKKTTSSKIIEYKSDVRSWDKLGRIKRCVTIEFNLPKQFPRAEVKVNDLPVRISIHNLIVVNVIINKFRESFYGNFARGFKDLPEIYKITFNQNDVVVEKN